MLATVLFLFAGRASASVGACSSAPNGSACQEDCIAVGHCQDATCVVEQPAPDGTACSSGNACSIDDVCSAGACMPDTVLDCMDGGTDGATDGATDADLGVVAPADLGVAEPRAQHVSGSSVSGCSAAGHSPVGLPGAPLLILIGLLFRSRRYRR